MAQYPETSDAELMERMEVGTEPSDVNPTSSMIGGLRRLVQPALLLSVGVLVGMAVHSATQTRYVPPVTLAKTAQNTELASWNSPTQHEPIPPGKTAFGGGFITFNGECYAAHCASGATCCKNLEQDGYCCAAGNYCESNGCQVPGTAYCFAGDANVDVRGKGALAMQDLQVGDHVLVQQAGAKLAYEPVLGFLHATRADEPTSHLVVSHPAGELRVSPNHIVFLADGSDKLAADLRVGDELAVVQGSGKVASIENKVGDKGMYAPLTASGTIVVDGVVASNYATHSSHTWIPHTSIHTAFFPLRLYHALGLNSFFTTYKQVESKHPFVHFLEDRVKAPALKMFNIK